MEQNETLAQLSLEIALSKVGIKEATGRNDGKDVHVFQDFIDGDKSSWMDGQPWCAAFMSWCVAQAADKLGITPVLKKSASSTEIFAMSKKLGTVLDGPVPNCIGLIKAPKGSGKTHEHTFRVISVDPAMGIVRTVDGNWKNSVCKTAHPIAACDFVALV